jgi:hypothetical protein
MYLPPFRRPPRRCQPRVNHWGAGAGLGCTPRSLRCALAIYRCHIPPQRTAQKLLWIALSTTVRLLTLRALISLRNAFAHSPQARNARSEVPPPSGVFLGSNFRSRWPNQDSTLPGKFSCAPSKRLIRRKETTPGYEPRPFKFGFLVPIGDRHGLPNCERGNCSGYHFPRCAFRPSR